ncbi:MAG: sulfatase-like hydrolase/transferase [Verrucomicrobia bacterium]|nr:sulfatase-like hydrolase/transferase [Verrucomicrobiota bacterium]
MKRALFSILGTAFLMVPAFSAEPLRPNILWITSEDHGPHLGCYGDPLATTPNVDALANRGLRYTHAWSNAPVCAPARTTLISGLYAPSTGGEHMRSMVPFPAGKKMYPVYLREAGYYCTNNSKEDYNIAKTGAVWDASSNRAHWRNRASGQPFFAIFNSTRSHESRLRVRPHKNLLDPARVRVPAYHPDTPEVRQDWAQYYDTVTDADTDAGRVLAQLEADGLADDTIVFYYADHGSGMPRSKRWPYNSGLQVPLIVHIPEKFKQLAPPEYKPGGTSDRLVSFVDLPPTLLSLAGIRPPVWMQGHAFLGAFQEGPQPFIHGFRGRMDERYDCVRSVTDGRYVYIRNYMPHKIYGQHINYMFQTPTTAVWKRMHDEGKLTPAQEIFWNVKAPEELYDLQTDPDEVHNLASRPEHQETRKRLRQAQKALVLKTRDLGFLPEGEVHSRSRGTTPYDMARTGSSYPLEQILEMAELASMLEPDAVTALKQALHHEDSAVRYWAALGLLMRGNPGVNASRSELTAALDDSSPYVRITAAEALGRYGNPTDLPKALEILGNLGSPGKHNVFVSMAALNALDALGAKAAPLADTIASFPQEGVSPDARFNSYVPRLLEDLTARFQN